MFTQEYLKSLATATVFSRGKDYFQSGSVGRLTREGDKFTAKVHGSYPYKVQLILKAGGAKLRCNCPYEFEGICKHAVALGLAVLKEFGPSLKASRTGTPALSPAILEAALRDTPPTTQLAFLAEVLRQDNALAQRFWRTLGRQQGPMCCPQQLRSLLSTASALRYARRCRTWRLTTSYWITTTRNTQATATTKTTPC